MIHTNYAIRSFKGGYDENFLYLVTCMQSSTQMVVDAALPLDTVKPYIHGTFLAMLITHSHGDHVAYLEEYTKEFPELLIIIYEGSVGKISAANVHPTQDNEQIQIGELNITALHTPGHYPDSLCFLMENVVFTGDTLFVGRTGRTLSQGSSTSQLYHSVYDKLLILPKDTLIYPGHDYGHSPTISIEQNIKISPLLQAAGEKDFIAKMAAFEAARKLSKK